MEYSIADLNPANPSITSNHREVIFNLYSLRIDVELTEKFGGFAAMIDKLNDKELTIFDVLWPFVKDKKIFENNTEIFKNFFLSSKDYLEIGKKLRLIVDEIITKSMPLVLNRKRNADLHKINKDAKDIKVCYASYFDKIAHRYGHDINQFYDLTLRQVYIFLSTINEKMHDELEIQAALQGRKLQERLRPLDISEDQEKENDEQAQDALKRLKDEYLKKKAEANGK